MIALELLYLEVNDPVVLAGGAGVAKGATAFIALAILSLPSLGLDLLRNLVTMEAAVEGGV